MFTALPPPEHPKTFRQTRVVSLGVSGSVAERGVYDTAGTCAPRATTRWTRTFPPCCCRETSTPKWMLCWWTQLSPPRPRRRRAAGCSVMGRCVRTTGFPLWGSCLVEATDSAASCERCAKYRGLWGERLPSPGEWRRVVVPSARDAFGAAVCCWIRVRAAASIHNAAQQRATGLSEDYCLTTATRHDTSIGWALSELRLRGWGRTVGCRRTA